MRRALVVGIHDRLTAEQAARLREELERRLPGVVCVVIDSCSSLTTLTLPGEAP